jgi:hypothetical protein
MRNETADSHEHPAGSERVLDQATQMSERAPN